MSKLLQKIVMVIISVFTMIASSISPVAFFPGDDAPGAEGAGGTGVTVDERLVTFAEDEDRAFASVGVLWVRVDGREVLEDQWGRGVLDEVTFKVGVKATDARSMRLGDETVPLAPTDVITIRDFNGRFAFKGVGTTDATIALDGHVKTTTVAQGEVTGKVRTQVLNAGADKRLPAGDDAKRDLAYVVLETGAKVDTVEWETGRADRVFTWAPDASDADAGATAVLAKWVKVNGRAITQYTWGEGEVEEILFEPTSRSTLGALVNWSGTEHALRPGVTVTVNGFVGTYVIHEAKDGSVKIRLDGYARDVTTTSDAETPVTPPTEGRAPVVSIGYAPERPTTTDHVRFEDLSHAPDGVIVFREWTFGDTNATTVLPSPKHKFQRPGTWPVTLKVTDSGLNSAQKTIYVTVGNTAPVADWDYRPKDVYSLQTVRFENRAWDPDDPDGPVSFQWDFGDGSPPENAKSPTHAYDAPGNYTVTLTATDAHGDEDILSKVVVVRNQPPLASFNATPSTPLTLERVTFTDASTDPDGAVAAHAWDFGDGATSAERNPTHVYERPGTYTVALTVVDDKGARDTATTTLHVNNQIPEPDFTFTPEGPVTTSTTLQFTDASTDVDGRIVQWRWNFGDGSPVDTRSDPRHRFREAGTYNVCLTVRDDQGDQSTACRSVGVELSPPVADFTWSPKGESRPVGNQSVTFTDLSYDPDGANIVVREWALGDGTTVTGNDPTHRYARKGTYLVTLSVTNDDGQTGEVSKTLEVFNAVPSASFEWAPGVPTTVDAITFDADARDEDGFITAYEWDFGDGATAVGESVTHRFDTPGTYRAALTVRDNDGGERTVTHGIHVVRASPDVNFTHVPAVPEPQAPVSFSDISDTYGLGVRTWSWDFGDGNTAVCDASACDHSGNVDNPGTGPEPAHVYARPGTYAVTLRVTLEDDTTDQTTRHLRVNALPVAAFAANRTVIGLGDTVRFTDGSLDSDGNVVSWDWAFGDGATATGKGPHEHAFSAPGPQTVRLTVTDNDGSTSTTERVVDVANRAPLAAFTWSPETPRRGSTTTFADASVDPDAPHDYIAAWEWDFADGTMSTAATPGHVFGASGVHTVKLTVRDTLGATSQTTEIIRVGNAHDLTFTLKTRLPDGRYLDHGREDVHVRVDHVRPAPFAGTTTYTPGVDGYRVLPNGDVEVRLPAATWAAGDRLDAMVQLAGDFTVRDTYTNGLTDDLQQMTHTMRLPVPLAATSAALGGETRAPVVDFTDEGAWREYPTYSNQSEPVRVGGNITWWDGVPARNAEVAVHMQYVGARALRGTLEELRDNPVTGWCHVASTRTDMAGAFETTLKQFPHCVEMVDDTGALLPGWYQVKVRATYTPTSNAYPEATPAWSEPTYFYEDPLGLLTGRVGFGAPP